jgi:hypothetical protein
VIRLRGLATSMTYLPTGKRRWQRYATPGRGGRGHPAAVATKNLNNAYVEYAEGNNASLARFEVRGVSLTGLGGAVAFDAIASLQVPPGGATPQITVTVIWQLPGQASAGITKLEMAYRMSVVDLQSGKWCVNEISAATEAVGAK